MRKKKELEEKSPTIGMAEEISPARSLPITKMTADNRLDSALIREGVIYLKAKNDLSVYVINNLYQGAMELNYISKIPILIAFGVKSSSRCYITSN